MTTRINKEKPANQIWFDWRLILPLAFLLVLGSGHWPPLGFVGQFLPGLFLVFGILLRYAALPELPKTSAAIWLDLSVPLGALIFFLLLQHFGLWSIAPARAWWIDLFLVSVSEEVFFRFGVLGRLRLAGVRWFYAIPLAALLFAVFHLPTTLDTVWLFRVFAGGLTFGVLYWWRQSIVAPILMHALLNQIT